MTLKEFQSKCLEVAVYPNMGKNYIYTFLGLVGEYGEFYEKVELMTECNDEESKKELGDIYWYFVMCCYELNLNMYEFQKKIDIPIANKLNKGFVNISKLSEMFKKVLRDNVELNENQLYGYFGLIEITLYSYIKYRGWNLDEILQMNVDKLQNRKERGVLHGSGDNR